MMVWAFNWTDDDEMRGLVYESLRNGKSRFGWSWKEEHNLLLENNRTKQHSRQLFLLQIEPKDWIVHVNTPQWGACVAARVTSGYSFDRGLQRANGSMDFRHYLDVDTKSVVEFDRNDPNVLPSVNLRPRYRYHRVYARDDFLQSIKNVRTQSVRLQPGETRQTRHLKDKTGRYLRGISELVHQMFRRHDLEHFLGELFKRLPGVVDVRRNGLGWGTDHGADLIVTMTQSMGRMEFERRIVVQAKSHGGETRDTKAVSQIREAIEQFGADAGMIVTTAETTEPLEQAIDEACKETRKPIDILAADDLGRFIIKHAPDLVFRM